MDYAAAQADRAVPARCGDRSGSLLVFVPHVGLGVNGGRRWIGVSGLSLQPSEFAKLALVIYLAAMLASRGERITSLARGLFPLCVPVAIMAMLVLKEPDMGTASLLGVHRVRDVLRGRRAPAASGGGLRGNACRSRRSRVLASPYRRARIFAFLDPWKDPQNTGFHIVQSLLALGSGGIFGVGSGRLAREVLLSARAVHRLHLLGARRGAGHRRRARGRRALRDARLSRDAHRARRAGPLRLLSWRSAARR